MTNEQQPQFNPAFAQDLNFDLQVFASPLDATPVQPLTPAQFRAQYVVYPRGHELNGKVIECEIRISDSRGGYAQYGRYDRIPNSFSQIEALDPRFPDHMLMSFANATKTFNTANGSSVATYHAEAFGETFIGTGNIANEALFHETSASSPVLVALTYSPGSYIRGLFPILQNSPTKNERLVVMRSGAAPEILPDAVPNAGSVMHANLTNGWGMLASPVNATTPGTVTNVFGANSGLWTLPSTAADADAPTQVLFNLPGVGMALGVEKLLYDMDQRMFWMFATDGNSSSWNVVHTNLEGTDPVRVKFQGLTGKIKRAWLWRRQVVATDGVTVEAFDGRSSRDLGYGNNRALNSDRKWYVLDGWVNNNDMGVWSVDTDGSATATTASHTSRLEQYLPETNAWLPISETLSINGIGVAIDSTPTSGPTLSGGHYPTIPWSKRSGYMQIHTLPTGSADIWNYLFVAQSRKNPFYAYNQTGTSAGFSKAFYSSIGSRTTPVWMLPPALGYGSLSRFPCVPTEIDMTETNLAFGAKSGGAPANLYMKVEVAVQSRSGTALTFTGAPFAQFTGANPIAARVKRFNDAVSFNWLQLRENMIRDPGSANSTPNGYPYTFRFLCFTDRKVRKPSECGGDLGGKYGENWLKTS